MLKRLSFQRDTIKILEACKRGAVLQRGNYWEFKITYSVSCLSTVHCTVWEWKLVLCSRHYSGIVDSWIQLLTEVHNRHSIITDSKITDSGIADRKLQNRKADSKITDSRIADRKLWNRKADSKKQTVE